MIYQVTYKDAAGNPLLEATFNAADAHEGLQLLLSTPSLAPPEGAVDFEVRRIESDTK